MGVVSHISRGVAQHKGRWHKHDQSTRAGGTARPCTLSEPRRRPPNTWLNQPRLRCARCAQLERHGGAVRRLRRVARPAPMLALLGSFGPLQYRTRFREGRPGAGRHRPSLPDPAWMRMALQTSGAPEGPDIAIPRRGAGSAGRASELIRTQTTFSLTAVMLVTPGHTVGSLLSSCSGRFSGRRQTHIP